MIRTAILLGLLLLRALACAAQTPAGPLTRVVATVNNGHMLQLQDLSQEFEAAHPDIKLRWVTLPESELRRVISSDIKTQMHRFDVVTVGMYEVPIWAEQGQLLPIKPPPNYDVNHLIDNIRDGLSYKGELYAVPFYGESSILYFRKDLVAKAGLNMPAQPTWSEVAGFAARLND